MFVGDVKNNILINELQLGEQLNECVHQGKRSDFSLLLAMLPDDVRVSAQFSLPKTVNDLAINDEESLRTLYNLPKAQSLALENLDEINSYNQAELVNDNKLIDLHLLNAINPRPLAFRDNKKYISQDVLGNTSLYCQKKYQETSKGHSVINERLNFNAELWLNTVNESIKKTYQTTAL